MRGYAAMEITDDTPSDGHEWVKADLARLMELALTDDARQDDVGPMAVMTLQLALPARQLVDDGMLSPRVWNRLGSPEDTSGLTFGDLLAMRAPWVEVLQGMKLRWKALRLQHGSTETGVAATALYYLTILLARIRAGARITSLADEDLRQGMQWLLRQKWLEDPIVELIEQLHSVDPWPTIPPSS